MSRNQKGFTFVEVLLVLLFVGVIGFVGWRVLAGNTQKSSTDKTSNKSTSSSQQETEEAETKNDKLIWQQTAEGWRSMEQAPACPSQPMMVMPVDIKKVTSVLYPGQYRGGNYKPHGGFRFDTSTDNAVRVSAPVDGFIVRGGRYITDGEVQYTFDLMNNCGVMYRVGHLRELPADLQKIADTWPQPTSNSATQAVNPAIFVKKGTPLATKVGFLQSKNTFVDWGVYDFRQENEASKSADFRSAHPNERELAWHAVCWLKDWLPAKDEKTLNNLPAGDPTSAKKSDYCK